MDTLTEINLKQLAAFVSVSDLKSFRRAAEKLNTTQPNISARITKLEDQLGKRLFDRDAGSVRLTKAGEALLPKARAVLASVDSFVSETDVTELFGGTLRLGVTEMIVHSWLSAYLTALKSKLPRIDIDLTVDYSANLTDALFNRSIDLALQSAPFTRQASGREELGSFPFAWVSAPGLLTTSDKVDLAEISQHPVLTHGRGTLPYEQLLEHASNAAGPKLRLFPSNNMSACLQMTRDGLGVACLPRIMVEREVEDRQLEFVDYNWEPDPLVFEARFEADIAPEYVRLAASLAREIAIAT